MKINYALDDDDKPYPLSLVCSDQYFETCYNIFFSVMFKGPDLVLELHQGGIDVRSCALIAYCFPLFYMMVYIKYVVTFFNDILYISYQTFSFIQIYLQAIKIVSFV